MEELYSNKILLGLKWIALNSFYSFLWAIAGVSAFFLAASFYYFPTTVGSIVSPVIVFISGAFSYYIGLKTVRHEQVLKDKMWEIEKISRIDYQVNLIRKELELEIELRKLINMDEKSQNRSDYLKDQIVFLNLELNKLREEFYGNFKEYS
jgi:hypothetical protein